MLLLSTVNSQQCGLALLVFCFSHGVIFYLTEPTDLTDVIASRVFSPTDYTDDSDSFFSFFSMSSFLALPKTLLYRFTQMFTRYARFFSLTEVTRFARSDA
jgi:hypothetical protein